MLLMNGVIRFVDVGATKGIWPRTIHIGQVRHLLALVNKTPRRLCYETKMQRMLVACSNVDR